MTGYLKPEFKNEYKKYKIEYKAFYCGLCKALKAQYSYTGILSLNYETTAILILLSGLKKEKSKSYGGSCSISPFVPVKYIDYFQEEFVLAAHLSLLIACYEIKDNVKDIGGFKWNIINKVFTKKEIKSAQALGDNYLKIESAIKKFYKVETNHSTSFEEILRCDGDLITHIFSSIMKNYDNETTKSLLNIVYFLGQWIYLIDAYDDFKDDVDNNRFNPLLLVDDLDNVKTRVKMLEKNISNEINKLPIKCHSDLIDFVFIKTMKKTSEKILSKFYKDSQKASYQ